MNTSPNQEKKCCSLCMNKFSGLCGQPNCPCHTQPSIDSIVEEFEKEWIFDPPPEPQNNGRILFRPYELTTHNKGVGAVKDWLRTTLTTYIEGIIAELEGKMMTAECEGHGNEPKAHCARCIEILTHNTALQAAQELLRKSLC